MASLTVLVGASLAVPTSSAWAGGGCSKMGGCTSGAKKKGTSSGKAKHKQDSNFQDEQEGQGGMIEVDADGIPIGQGGHFKRKDAKLAMDTLSAFLESQDSGHATTVWLDGVKTEFDSAQASHDGKESKAHYKDEGLIAALAEEFQRCGVSFKGSNCLDKKFISVTGFYQLPLLLQGDSALVFNLLGHEDKAVGLVLITEIALEHPHAVRSVQVASYDKKLKKPEEVRTAYVKGKVATVLSASIAAQPIDYAVQALKATSDPKMIYHLSDYLLHKGPSCVEVLEKLFTDSRKITQSDVTVYQIALLNLVTGFHLERGLIEGIANELLESKTPEVVHLAAIALAELGVKTDGVKQQVRGAMSSKTWSTRKRAVEAFSHIRESALDDGAFLDAMGDSDNDVKEAARVVVAQITFSNAHLPELERHLSSTNWATRKHMIELLGTVQTPEANRLILKGLVDSDNDVRKVTDGLLASRQIQKEDVPVLQELSKNKQSEGRVLVTKYLGKIATKKSRNTLIQLSTDTVWSVRQEALRGLKAMPQGTVTAAFLRRIEDSDNDVKNLALSAMETRQLHPTDLPVLEELIKSNSWSTRQTVLGYLTKIETSESTGLMLSRLCDSDKDVRNRAVQFVKTRKIGDSEVQVLATLAHQASCPAKDLLPQFIAQGYSRSSQNIELVEQGQTADLAFAALAHLAKDNSYLVRMSVVKSLERHNTEEVSALFTSMLTDNDGDVKKLVTGILMSRKFASKK